MSIIQKTGFDFSFDSCECEGCPGYCCCGKSGNIWVSQNEILQISSFLQINIIDYIGTYLNRIGNRFSIKERLAEQGLECVFFEPQKQACCGKLQHSKKQCSIYPVRPFQCRQYPFWEHFKEHKDQVIKECPGIIAKK